MTAAAQPSPTSAPYGQRLAGFLAWSMLQRASGDESPPDRRSGTPAEQSIAPGPGKQRLRILIIEDNRDYAETLQVFFELHGHEATLAFSGTEGVEAALRHPPDVAICDLGLPGLDGFEVARTLRRNPLTAHIRLIAVTGYGTDRDRRYSAECGFTAHLVKPVEAGEILKLIDPQPD